MTDNRSPRRTPTPARSPVIAAMQLLRAGFIVGQFRELQFTPGLEWLSASAQFPDPPPGTVAHTLVRFIGIGIAAASLVVGVGLFTGRRWGWVGSIVLSGLSLAFAIGAWWDGHPGLPEHGDQRVAVFYLNQRDVRAAFEDPAASDTPDPAMIDPADLELLRRHEPILRFTQGELFLPMPTQGYVESCDLLSGPTIREATVVAPAGTLTLDKLGAIGDPPPGHLQYLRFVPEPMNAVELARWRNRPDRPRSPLPAGLPGSGCPPGWSTQGSSRRSCSGDASRAARPPPPIGATPRSASSDPRVSYHGRVIRTEGWVVLHYLFFYAMNDWRSTFDGANDHEADWEQCFIVLEELDDGPTRAGLVLRRGPRREGRRPPPALGRSAPRDARRPPDRLPGRRLARDLPRARRVHHAAAVPRRAEPPRPARPAPQGLAGHARPARSGDLSGKVARALSVPFVDYARGDGSTVGPGCDYEWTPIVISDDGPLGRRLPRPVGPRHRRPVRRRASAGGPEVHADRDRPPVVGRPARILRARQGRRRRPAHRPSSPPGSPSCEQERDDVRDEAEAIAALAAGAQRGGGRAARRRRPRAVRRAAPRRAADGGGRARDPPGAGRRADAGHRGRQRPPRRDRAPA